MHRLVKYFSDRQGDMLEGIRALVEVESPSTDKSAVDRVISVMAAYLEGVGARIERIPAAGRGDHLRARWGREGEGGILVLSHLDTVWPLGELESRPFRVEGDLAYGPGIFDMKGGAFLSVAALGALGEMDLVPRSPITLLYTSDEEIGSPTSRDLIEAEARRSRYVLVLEPALGPNGAAKTSRKGCGIYNLSVRGRAAHAGVDHSLGRSAVAELARQITRLEAMTDYDRGTTLNVGMVRGGSRRNVVPASAEAEIDLRVKSAEEATRMHQVLMGLGPLGDGVSVEITGEINRPPFERHAGVAALYELGRRMAGELGFDLPEGSTGGGSDGNFTANLGLPTLDGLGMVGDGAHALHEHIRCSALPHRAALLTRLFSELG